MEYLHQKKEWDSFRSGILQAGDRILSINGQILEGMTIEDARLLIKRSNNQIHLEIEFDVTGKSFHRLLKCKLSKSF